MVFINEWLPNPTGADAAGEFIELFNNGAVPVDLGGWSLEADGKKKFKLSGIIQPNGYLVLPRSRTKLSLKNTDGILSLYNGAGVLADRSTFEGTAPEGESFNRTSYTVQQFVWGKPTAGAKNSAVTETGISDITYPTEMPLNVPGLGWSTVLWFALAAGVIFAAVSWYALKHDEGISQLFFGRDEAIRT